MGSAGRGLQNGFPKQTDFSGTASLADTGQADISGITLKADAEQADISGMALFNDLEQAEKMGVGGRVRTQTSITQ